ncbi:anti-sigma factor family protein [Sulfuritalea hydrogenivorans]|jgi:hypothetical protein|uniref:Zinc-finger domain-containing protein n=1 Tax=Sulfuritalea hydrogenivorans sk43H TaxID=1223802 RepID=W0SDJ7_9PROT|nr:hypothetical protein [Sulfuritalea hydrogenivorans]MDK9713005.1 hypothetical protein [Sulfuritalea sp.]BAO29017.1 hypothetical protein SUTH_01217 [Sulfuritalea hydrogenivorans sk43H]
MLNCKESTHLISEAEDRSLKVKEKLALEMHILLCKGCRNYRDQMAFLRRACEGYKATLTDDKEIQP